MLARRAQFHQFRFTEHLNPLDPRYQFYTAKAAVALQGKVAAVDTASKGLIYRQLLRESNMAAFSDVFFLSTVLLLCVIPLVFLLKRPKHADVPVNVH